MTRNSCQLNAAALTVLLQAFVLFAASIQHSAANFSAIFVFGDSYWDIGNNNYGLSTFPKANFLPYSYRYLPASGRWSDGKMAIDYICKPLVE